jgi:hypothetical protein
MNRKDKTRITAAGIESYGRSKILLDKGTCMKRTNKI